MISSTIYSISQIQSYQSSFNDFGGKCFLFDLIMLKKFFELF